MAILGDGMCVCVCVLLLGASFPGVHKHRRACAQKQALHCAFIHMYSQARTQGGDDSCAPMSTSLINEEFSSWAGMGSVGKSAYPA